MGGAALDSASMFAQNDKELFMESIEGPGLEKISCQFLLGS